MSKPIIWTIAGSDSCNGAGIHTDLKTFHALRTQGCSVTTAVTAQNHEKITGIQYISPNIIAAQMTALQEKFFPASIKIGMLGQIETIDTLCEFLQTYSGAVVLDPVISSSSGFNLFSTENYLSELKKLFPYIELFTPNLNEVKILLNRSIESYDDIQSAADEFLNLGVKNILIKGGHFPDSIFSQDYWSNGTESFWLASKRFPVTNYRGTGCALSSAITACLALGYTIKDALVIAKMFVNQGIRKSITRDDAAYLFLDHWPEEEIDLPFLSHQPLHTIPKKFADCNQTSLGVYPVVDSVEWIKKLIPLGITTIQLRIKNISANLLEHEIEQAIQYAKKHSVRLFINDYWELAVKYQAYGVHLGQEDLHQADTEKIYAAGLRLGISTHCYYEVARAHTFNPSYIACGPIYSTQSKQMPFQPQGIENLKRWRKTLSYPLVAIGGINQERMADVVATGVDGVAMISAITQARDYVHVIRELMNARRPRESGDLSGDPRFREDDVEYMDDELDRYKHNLKLPEVGTQGQTLLKKSRILVIGAGGLGCPLLLYLTAAGVGNIGIVDHDKVELSNLQRQILFQQKHLHQLKVHAAKEQLLALNENINITIFPEKISSNNAVELIQQYDIVADCSDNFATRYLINDVCFSLKKPYVSASVFHFSGQCVFFSGNQGPCLRCLFPQPSLAPSCEENGVLGVLPGILGMLQSTEIIKWIIKAGESLCGRLLTVDTLSMKFREFQFDQNPDCELCHHQKSIEELMGNHCCSHQHDDLEITVTELKELLDHQSIVLIDVRTHAEREQANIGGVFIPLAELQQRIDELDPDEKIVTYCHAGGRSLEAVKILKAAGFTDVKSLRGGIVAYFN